MKRYIVQSLSYGLPGRLVSIGDRILSSPDRKPYWWNWKEYRTLFFAYHGLIYRARQINFGTTRLIDTIKKEVIVVMYKPTEYRAYPSKETIMKYEGYND